MKKRRNKKKKKENMKAEKIKSKVAQKKTVNIST